MAQLSETDVIKALEGVQDPDLGKDLTELGMIKDIVIKEPKVALRVELTTPACPLKDVIGNSVKEAITTRLETIQEVDIEWSSQVRASFPTGNQLLPGVRNILLVASGKGGVGKSTISANIASALAQSGARVGLLDCDVYGPSLPTAFGIHTRPEGTEDQRILPAVKYGMKLMSMGMLLEEGQPVVWRGPMLDGAMKQFLGQVEWGELDYLVLDLPPGTGDVQLSLSRLVPQACALIVTTPQDIALADVKRAYNMFRQVNIEVLGLVENMSGFVCPSCGHHADIFLSGGGKKAAEEILKVDFFGEIPLTLDVAQFTDQGIPAVIEDPESSFSSQLKSIAGKVAQKFAIRSTETPESDSEKQPSEEEQKPAQSTKSQKEGSTPGSQGFSRL